MIIHNQMNFIKITFSIILLYFISIIKGNNLKKSFNNYIKKRLLTEDLCNSEKLSCFECNSPLKSCIYNQNICSISYDNDTTELFWYSKLMSCKDKESENKMSNYCGTIKIDTSNREIQIKDSKLYGSNSIDNLFCSWEIAQTKEIGNIRVNFKDIISKTYLGLFIFNSDAHSYYEIDDIFSEKISKKKFNKIKIIYFHSQIPQSTPFKMTIRINIGIKFSDIALYFIIVFGFIFIVVSMITLILFIRKISNNQNFKKNQKRFEIEKLSTVKYIEGLDIYNENCPICLDEILKNSEIVLLKCNHGFHVECIMKWIKSDVTKNRHCPICNLNFKQDKEKICINENSCNNHSN